MKQKKLKGSVLAYSLIILAIMFTIVGSMSTVSVLEKSSAGSSQFSSQAFQIADSGVQLAIKKINDDTLKNITETFGPLCNNGAVTKNMDTGVGEYDLYFMYKNGNVIEDCSVQVKDIHKVKSIGKFKNAVRAVEVNVCADACCGATTFKDEREAIAQEYKVIAIGTQCWMARNLNYGTAIGLRKIDGTSQPQADTDKVEKYCRDYVTEGNAAQKTTGEANCASEGGFYQWAEAHGKDSPYNSLNAILPAKNQGICPDGWHVATDEEITTLKDFLGAATAADQLKKPGSCGGRTPCGTATNGDPLGFDAALSGLADFSTGSFVGATGSPLLSYLWLEQKSASDGKIVYFKDNSPSISTTTTSSSKVNGLPVRCISD